MLTLDHSLWAFDADWTASSNSSGEEMGILANTELLDGLKTSYVLDSLNHAPFTYVPLTLNKF